MLRARLLAPLLFAAPAMCATLFLRVAGEDGKPVPARLEVRGEEAMYQCASGINSTRMPWKPGRTYYGGSFVMEGECSLEAPAGTYTIIAERGPEYERLEREVRVAETGRTEVTLRPKRWIDMRGLGWWSGEFHIHRTPEDAPLLARAEDLNLSVVFTVWNKQNYWSAERPPVAVRNVSPHNIVSLLNAEDERGGGAWMLHALPEPPNIAAEGRWYPPGIRFIRAARALRPKGGVLPWVDLEKLIWWEVPIVVALETPDSAGLAHNHLFQYGFDDSEAWGRPRDRARYPGVEGLVLYTMDLYYRYLNLGFRMAPSAGSASGVKPSPVGYNRVYVKMSGALTLENWYAALRSGQSMATNGPMVFAEVKRSGGRTVLAVDARAREAIDRIEVIANGEVVGRKAAADGATTLGADFPVDAARHSWVAARCFLKTPRTVRFGHTSPIYLDGRWDAAADARYFAEWTSELIKQAETDPKRFANERERDEVLALYREALAVYEKKAN